MSKPTQRGPGNWRMVARMVVLIGAAGLGPARADILVWQNTAGGSAATAANWNPVQVPTGADDLVFSLNNNYTITWNASVGTSGSQTYRFGDVTASLSSAHTCNGQLKVGQISGDDAVMILRNTPALFSVNSFVTIGQNTGSTGRLTVDDGTTTLRTFGSNSDVIVGQAGTGFLTCTDGGDVISDDDVLIGNLAGGTGTVTISADALQLPHSFVRSSGADGDIIIGVSGSGSVSVAGNATLTAADDLILALSSGSSGSLTVGGGSFLHSPTINVGDALDIARNLAAGSAAGTGSFTVNAGAVASVNGTTTVGDADGGSGTLHVDGGSFTTGDLVFDPTNGFLDFDDGAITVDAGSFVPPDTALMLNGGEPGDLPTLRLVSGASGAVDVTLIVGSSFNREAALRIESGSTMDVGNGVIIGQGSGSEGTILVTGAGSSLSAPFSINVGLNGNGTLNIENGGQATSAQGGVASAFGSTGAVTVTGAGSLWDVNGDLAIGGNTSSQQGVGQCSIASGGLVDVRDNVILWPTGTLSITGGTLQADVVTLRGQASLSLGTIDATQITTIPGATISGRGALNAAVDNEGSISPTDFIGLTINGLLTGVGEGISGTRLTFPAGAGFTGAGVIDTDVFLQAGSVCTATGALTLGRSSSALGVGALGGTLNVGPHTVTLLDFDDISCSPSTIIQLSGGHLVFSKPLLLNGAIQGSGFLDGRISTFGGAPVITATGNLTMGDAASADGFVLGPAGELHVAGHVVTLRDADLAQLFNPTHLEDGQLVAVNGIRLSGILQGNGAVLGDVLNHGIIAPGASAGRITIDGDYQTDPTGAGLSIELGGTTPVNTYDVLEVTGTAALAGTLEISLIDGFEPRFGDSFVIMTYASHTGDFDIFDLPDDTGLCLDVVAGDREITVSAVESSALVLEVARVEKGHAGTVEALEVNLAGRVEDGNVTSEPRQGGITGLMLAFDSDLAGPLLDPVTIEEQTCPGGSQADYVPYTGSSVMSAVADGGKLLLSFNPGLENARTYRITINGCVTSIPGQSIEVRGLVGDANSDGAVNALDRSVLIGVWTGSGFSPRTDLNLDGQTNALDRSIVIGAWTNPAANCAP